MPDLQWPDPIRAPIAAVRHSAPTGTGTAGSAGASGQPLLDDHLDRLRGDHGGSVEARRVCHQGDPARLLVLFTSAMAPMTTLVSGHAEERLEERLAHLAKPKLLIMDEFGYPPFEGADWFLAHAVLSTRKTAWAVQRWGSDGIPSATRTLVSWSRVGGAACGTASRNGSILLRSVHRAPRGALGALAE